MHQIIFYISDRLNHRVQKLDGDGSPIAVWPLVGEAPGNGNGQFHSPSGIALNPSGTNVYVANSSNHRVQVFTPSFGFIKTWGWIPPNYNKVRIQFTITGKVS